MYIPWLFQLWNFHLKHYVLCVLKPSFFCCLSCILNSHQNSSGTPCSTAWTGTTCRTSRCPSYLSRRTKPTPRTLRPETTLSTSPCLASVCSWTELHLTTQTQEKKNKIAVGDKIRPVILKKIMFLTVLLFLKLLFICAITGCKSQNVLFIYCVLYTV